MIASTNAGRVFGDPSASQVGCAMVSDSWLVSDAELLVGIALQRIASSGAASTAALRMDRRSVSTPSYHVVVRVSPRESGQIRSNKEEATPL